MFRMETNNRIIINHLKRIGLYDRLMSGPITSDNHYPIRIHVSGENIYVYFSGHEDPKENGWVWINLHGATRMERLQIALSVTDLMSKATAIYPA